MEIRYQVFVSSTFSDLVDERRAVQQAVLSLSHFPAGMELFPASDEDQWELIKSVIDDSDFYVIVVGGRYGSRSSTGISYTEMEFDYAVAEGKPILAFVHSDPDKIIAGKTDQDDSARHALDRFREKVSNGRHIKFWDTADNLQTNVLQALVTETKKNPQLGWVRASEASDPAALATLKEELRQLRQEGPPRDIDNLQGGTDQIQLEVKVDRFNGTGYHVVNVTWDTLFQIVGPIMMQEATEAAIRKRLVSGLLSLEDVDGKFATGSSSYSTNVSDDQFDQVKFQLFALGLIAKGKLKRAVADKGVYWCLSPYGEGYLMRLRALKREA